MDSKTQDNIKNANKALQEALKERSPQAVQQKKGPKPLVIPPSTPNRNPFAQDAAQRRASSMTNRNAKRQDSNKNWRKHLDDDKPCGAPAAESAPRFRRERSSSK